MARLIKNDITTNYFHDEYVKDHERIHLHEEKSRRIYSKIIRIMFDFIKMKLYEGFLFTTPIGHFKIVKVHLNPRLDRKLISYAATELAGKPVYRDLSTKKHFHQLRFFPMYNLENRYTFKGLQHFVKNIHHYYD